MPPLATAPRRCGPTSRCRRALATELGVAPDQETVDLHLRLLGTEEPGPAQATDVAGPFYGRTASWPSCATDRRRRVVSVVGPGGIGKSRLVEAFVADPGQRVRRRDDPARHRRAGTRQRSDGVFAAHLGVGATAMMPSPAVLDELAKRGRSLVVLDGVDHVADEAAGLIAAS